MSSLIVHRSGLAACFVAALAGALATLSLSPFNLWPALIVALPALIWLLDGAGQSGSLKRGFAIGWSFAFGYFVLSLWWISEAFWIEAERFAALIPFAVAGLPAYLAVYWGLACAIAVRFWGLGWRRIVLLACLLAIGEWLRGHLLTGFPWNLPGYGVSSVAGLSQSASLFGIYGLTLMVLLVSAAPAALWQKGYSWKQLQRGGSAFVIMLLGLAIGLHIWGTQRLEAYDAAGETHLVRIVQPSIPQTIKWNKDRRQEIIDIYLEMSARPWKAPLAVPPLVVWPESALPLLLGDEDVLRQRISGILPRGSILLTGGLHRTTAIDGVTRVFNSLLVIGQGGQILGRHDKVRLVPFGEFLPFSNILEPLGIRQLARLPQGFSEGLSDKVVSVPSLPSFAGFICYEAVFPRSFPRKKIPNLLINVTNDAWFGTSGGPHQHLAHARFRAIEQGVPLLRAANTGISVMVDAAGRITASLPLLKAGILDAPLPAKLPVTLYARLGDSVFGLFLLFLMAIYLICRLSNL